MATDPVPVKPESNAEILAKFVENQTKELEHRAQELDLEKQKDDHAFEYGKEALAAQERDRKHERECHRQQRKDWQRFIIWIAGFIVLLIGTALFMDKDKIAEELVKALVYVSAGAAAGYGIATRRKAKPNNESDD